MWIILCVRRDQSKPDRPKHVYCSLAKWHLVDVMKSIRCKIGFATCLQMKYPFLRSINIIFPSFREPTTFVPDLKLWERTCLQLKHRIWCCSTNFFFHSLLRDFCELWLILKKGTEDRSASQNYSNSCSSEIQLLTTKEGIFLWGKPATLSALFLLCKKPWLVSYQKQLKKVFGPVLL